MRHCANGFQNLPPFAAIMPRLNASSSAPNAMAIKSFRFIGRFMLHHVRFFLSLPKPRSSIALEITSMRCKLDRINRSRMFDGIFEPHQQLLPLLPSSMPRAC